MRELAVLTFVSIDGIMQSPSAAEEDPSGGFDLGGWAAPYWEEVMPQVEHSAMSESYDILFGRKTYDIFSGHWPDAPKSDLSDQLNSAQKYVVTSSTKALSWQNSSPLTGDAVSEIQKLKSTEGPLLQVHGSSELIHTLHNHDLIDEYRVWTFPVVLGRGKKLFGSGAKVMSFSVQSTNALDNGVIGRIFRPS